MTTAPAGTYFVEGIIHTKLGGRSFYVRRLSTGDTKYQIRDSRSSGAAVMSQVNVVSVAVADNPTADRQAPEALSMIAAPASADRCQVVNLTLKLSDDKGLPGMQMIKVKLGTQAQPDLASVVLTARGDSATGLFTVPQDAPGGVWYAYPESFRDSTGNEARGTLSGDNFTLSGPGLMPKPIKAGLFIVAGDSPKGDMGGQDLGVAPGDMSAVLPASLVGVSVMPASITMMGQTATISVNWTDNARILK